MADPELADFTDFINDENLLASDPRFSQEALKVYVKKEERSRLKEKMKSFASNTTDMVQEEKDEGMFINMRQFLAVLWTLGLLLHFYLLHEFFLLDYETILSNLKLYKLSFRKYNLSKN